MLVEVTVVSGPLDEPDGVEFVNPKHIVRARRGVNASDPEAQSFVTELTLEVGGKLRVEGNVTDVVKKLNGGGR